MHLPADHHATSRSRSRASATCPAPGSRTTRCSTRDQFAAYRNTVQTAKLLLLDGNGLNAALGDILVAAGVDQGRRASRRTPRRDAGQPDGRRSSRAALPWLRSIDSDHSWRVDGRPRFCAAEDAGCPAASAPTAAGEAQRRQRHVPALGVVPAAADVPTLYRDWENGNAQFPALGDAPSAPTRATRTRPSATLAALAATTFTGGGIDLRRRQPHVHGEGGRRRVRRRQVAAQYRSPRPATSRGAWHWTSRRTATFTIPAGGGDGTYKVQLRTADPCHTFDASRRAAGRARRVTRTVFLDTTPPEITITKPAPEGVAFDSDDFSRSSSRRPTPARASRRDVRPFDGAAATQGPGAGHVPARPGPHTVKCAPPTTSATRPTARARSSCTRRREPAEQHRAVVQRIGADRRRGR